MTRAFAAFANGGQLVRPRLTIDQAIERELVIQPETAAAVTSALILATGPEGTGRPAVEPGYSIAGKTGTAQMVDPETKTYSRTDYRASFIGFATDQDRRIVITTLLDRPEGNYYASANAAPLFRKVFQSVATRFSFPSRPDWKQVYAKVENQYRRLDERRALKATEPRRTIPSRPVLARLSPVKFSKNPADSVKIPDLYGLSPRQALRKLAGFPVDLRVSGSGAVRVQRPEAGAELKRGGRLELVLSYSEREKEVRKE
jgi:membrane peptidoglycan carboxypeptidase